MLDQHDPWLFANDSDSPSTPIKIIMSIQDYFMEQ